MNVFFTLGGNEDYFQFLKYIFCGAYHFIPSIGLLIENCNICGFILFALAKAIVVVHVITRLASKTKATVKNDKCNENKNGNNGYDKTDIDGFGVVDHANIVGLSCFTADVEGNKRTKCFGDFNFFTVYPNFPTVVVSEGGEYEFVCTGSGVSALKRVLGIFFNLRYM